MSIATASRVFTDFTDVMFIQMKPHNSENNLGKYVLLLSTALRSL